MTTKAEKAIEAQRKAQELFGRFVVAIRRQITQARMIEGNEPKAAMLEGALSVARRDMEDLELELGALLLSKNVTEAIISDLTDAAEQADELLKEMEDLSDFLGKVEKGARLIGSVLKTVAKVAG